MKKTLKIFSIVIVSVFVLLLVVAIFVVGKIVPIVKTEANKLLDAKVEFSDLKLSLIRNFPYASINLKDLCVSGKGAFDQDTLISIDNVGAVVNLKSIFGNNGYEVTKVFVEKPYIMAMKLEDGSVNWDITKDTGSEKEKKEKESDSQFVLQLKDVRINDGEIFYLDDSTKIQAHIDGLFLGLKGDMTAQTTDLNLHTGAKGISFINGGISLLNDASLDIAADISADLENNKYSLKENSIKLNEIILSLDGWVEMLDNDGIDMDISLNSDGISFKDLLSMIPAFYMKDFQSLSADGSLSIEAWAKGLFIGDTLPSFNLAIGVKDGKFKYEMLPESVNNIQINASVENPGGDADLTTISVPTFSLSMAGQALRATLEAQHPISDLQFDATVDGAINLENIKRVYPLPDSIELKGLVNAAMAVSAVMSDIENKRFENISATGDFSIKDVVADISDMPVVKIQNATASISPANMLLSDLSVNVGSSDIQASGKVSNYLAYLLKDDMLEGNLTVKSSMLDLNELMTGEKTTDDDSDTIAMQAIEVPKNLNLALAVDIDNLLLRQMKLSNIIGRVSMKEGVLSMDKLSMNAFNGTISANGSYSTKDNAKMPALDISVEIGNAKFAQTFRELELIQKIVPIFEKTGGVYSMKLNLNTLLNENMSPLLSSITSSGLLATGNIDVKGLKVLEVLSNTIGTDKLQNIQAKDVSVNFSIENGKLVTKPFNIKMGDILMNLSGETGLDQSINYVANITLPQGIVSGYSGTVPVTIGGTFSSPIIGVDVKGVASTAIKQTITNNLDKVVGDSIASKITSTDLSETILNEAREAGNKLIEEAKAEGEKLVEKADNPLKKIAAQKSADLLVQNAQKQADKLMEEAEAKIAASKHE